MKELFDGGYYEEEDNMKPKFPDMDDELGLGKKNFQNYSVSVIRTSSKPNEPSGDGVETQDVNC